MGAATAPAFNAPIGVPPTLEWIPVVSIGIDPAYQRGIDNDPSQRFIRAIARDWDWSLCLPLKLARRDDGSMWAVDGQHRLSAALLRGDIPHLPCVIGRYASNCDEAAAFVALNRQRRALGSMDLFKAAIAAGDDETIEVMAAIKASGLRLAPHSNYNNWKPGMLYCAPSIQRAWKLRGPIPTKKSMVMLAKAFDGQILRFAGLLLEGLYEIFTTEGRLGSFDLMALEAALGAVPQAEWIKRALREQGSSGCSRAAAMRAAMLAAYARAGGRNPAEQKPAPVAPATQKPRRTFEETLAAVEAGEITVTDKVTMTRAAPEGIFGSSLVS